MYCTWLSQEEWHSRPILSKRLSELLLGPLFAIRIGHLDYISSEIQNEKVRQMKSEAIDESFSIGIGIPLMPTAESICRRHSK